MHTTGTTTARAYSALVYHTLSAMVRGLPQGETASITLRAGLVIEAKVDTNAVRRYTVRRDGVASRGISALVIALEAHWEAEHAQGGDADALAECEAAGRAAKAIHDQREAACLDNPSDWPKGDHMPQAAQAPAAFIACNLADNTQAAPGQGLFDVTLSNGLRTVGVVRVLAYNSIEASTKAEAAWPGAMSVGARLCAPDNLDDVRKPQAPASAASTMTGWHRLG